MRPMGAPYQTQNSHGTSTGSAPWKFNIHTNVFALQTILGHESLDMVKRYLMIAQTDLQKAHQDASPVMNWLL